MKNKYFNSKIKFGFFVALMALLLGSNAEAQVIKPFTQRTSQYSPTKKIYNIKGDFTMIGNTNLTFQNYSDGASNTNKMVYVDVDGNSNTLNSSSATLSLPVENDAIAACSDIVYAGLYWTGRSSDASTSPNTFSVTKNGVTKHYDKRAISIKGPGAAGYTTITAGANDIYYPTTNDGFMYSAYAEVTDYVRNNGVGAYTVADMALIEGSGGSTGYYGGWSLIVVYENSKMKYRDVTIFDGHAYVAGSVTANYEIPVSGFNTVQAGSVNMKLGLMAGEGDRDISGDYFQIRNAANTAWVTLTHSGNSSNNFFNSSIVTGGNARNPHLSNNSGLDISMFNIANANNSVIGNNQTSTKFRYGTTQDTFVIFAAAMAVDAYIPDVEGSIAAVTVNGVPATTPVQAVLPGQDLVYKVEIRNKGTEAINNFKVTIPIPYNATYVQTATKNIYFTPAPSPNNLTFEPTIGSNGSIVWNLGTLPLPANGNPDTLLGDLTFTLKATEDCTLLKNANCNNVVATNGIITGTGAITGIVVTDKSLIQGYTNDGSCTGVAISAPFLVNINAVDYVNTHCQGTPPITAFVFCSPGANIPITSISGSFPAGSLFYNQFPVTGASTQYTINNPFPATVGTSTYYAVPPNSVSGCYFQFTITVTTITSQPTTTDLSYCQNAQAAALTATPSAPGMTLYYYTSVNGTAQMSIVPSTAAVGQTTYYVAEGQSTTCIGPKKPIVVTVYPAPTITAPANATIEGCSTAAITGLPYSTTAATITLAQLLTAGGLLPNSANIGVYTLSYIDVATGTCPIIVTRTYTVSTLCGNVTAQQTITISDTTPPVISALPALSVVSCESTPVFVTPTATDNCGGAVTLTFVDVNTAKLCAGSYRITRTWTATDACGNISTASQSIDVTDATPPVISQLPPTSTINCPATPVFAIATATDACGSDFTLTSSDVTTPGSCAGNYSVTRTWTAVDGCGNAASASQTINVIDNTPPVISTLPAASTIACTETPQWTTPTATDTCSGNVTLTSVDVTTPGACANANTITRTWTATDACGNTATATQVINVIDNTPPTISTLPAASTIACTETPQWTTPTATDTCSGNVTLTSVDVTTPGACANANTITRTWTATDACGNTATATQVINVIDNTPPTISALPVASTISCPATPQWITPTATDTCSGNVTLTSVDVTTPGACANANTITRTWTATDACGNTATASQVINMIDNVPPTISTLPAASTIACTETPQWTTPTATDTCSGNVTLTSVDVTTPGACANANTITRTWTATDACGNTATASQVINMIDNVPPTISTLPAASTIACTETPQWTTPTATDTCSGNVTLTSVDVTTPGACSGSYSVTRTWTATDACGNTATATQVINVIDNTPPTISALPVASTISCPAMPQWITPTATDTCSGNVTLTSADVTTPGSCAGNYSVTRTWTATDACGNISTSSQTINVQDITAPAITAEAQNLTVQCDGSGNAGAITAWLDSHAAATAADACSDVTWTNNFNTLSSDCSAAVTVIFTATDACGNTSTTSATFTVQDTTAPVAPAAPQTANVICASDVPANISLTATDNCAGAITVQGVDTTIQGSCPSSFVTTRTWTFTDACGNSSDVSQTINVNDTVAPIAPEAPAALTVSCAGEIPAMISLTASDNCGEQITAEGVDATVAGDCPNSFVITRTWTFTDACGNSSDVSQTITINDIVPPVIAELPAVSTINCPAAPAFAVATATDNCAGDVTLTSVDATTEGACSGSYSVTRTWTATDACGNTATAIQTINVQDNTAPVISPLPETSTIDCPAQPVFAEANAVDACGSAFTLTSADVTTPGSCAGNYSVTRTWTATDACGNISTSSQTINVQDITAPAITAEAQNLTVQCDGSGNAGAITAWLDSHAAATATDACSDVSWTNNFNTLSSDCSAAVTVIFTATDACGNTSTTSATFTVQDTTAPVAPAAPQTANVVCASDVPANISLTATDNCAGAITVQGVDTTIQGSCPNSFVTTRTWTFTDACGNSSDVSQTINVNDTVAPIAPEAPAALTVSCAGEIPAMISLTASDNCGEQITAEGVDATVAGDCPNSFVITRTWTFTDACGNSSDVSQTINVNDTVAPIAPEAPAALTVSCAGEVPAMISLTASDNCGEQITAEGVDATVAGDCPNSFVITRTWTFTDACGNTSSATQTITVNDTTAPVAPEAPANINATCTVDVPVMISLTATDNCGDQITVEGIDTTVAGACPNSFVTTRTWTFTDACGNSSSTTQTISVTDTVPPTFVETTPADISVSCDAIPAAATLTAVDNCDNAAVPVTMTETTVAGNCPNASEITRTWSATDACGNTATTSQVITVMDVTPPTFDAPIPADVSVSCDAVPTAATITASDNCGTASVTYTETRADGLCPSSYVLTRTWIATDLCGNQTVPAVQVINVSDTTGPTIDGTLENVVVGTCDNIPVAPQLTFIDNCSTVGTPVFTEVIDNPTESATYSIVRTWTIADACGNESVFTQTVNVTPNPDFTVTVQGYAICNDPTQATAIDLNTLLPQGTPAGGTWTDLSATGGLTGSSFNPSSIPVGFYDLQYAVADGNCSRTVNVHMEVDDDCGVVEACASVLVHNAFSPNNDGLNEWFQIDNLELFDCYPKNSVEIYNRWGVLVYEAKQYDNAANSFKGVSEGRTTVDKASELPTGTYFYILQYNTTEGKTVKKDGYLYLSR